MPFIDVACKPPKSLFTILKTACIVNFPQSVLKHCCHFDIKLVSLKGH